MREGSWARCLGVCFGVGFAAMCVAREARATVDVQVVPERQWRAPAGLDLATLELVGGPQSTTGLFGTVGVGADIECVVVLASSGAATSFRFRRAGALATECTGLVPLEDGGFVVRAQDPDPLQAAGLGGAEVARVDADGRVLWRVADREVFAEEGAPGVGAYAGAYEAPALGLLVDERARRVVAFTSGVLRVVGKDQVLLQAHTIGLDSGALSRVGLTFGNLAGAQFAEGFVDRSGFVVAMRTEERAGAAFFRFDGVMEVDELEPLRSSWEERALLGMGRGPRGAFALAWETPESAGVGEMEVALTDLEGRPFWRTRVARFAADSSGGSIDLGNVSALAADESAVITLHVVGQRRVVRVFDARTGEEYGISTLAKTSLGAALGVVGGADGPLRLVGVNTSTGRLADGALGFEDVPGVPVEEPGDMGLSQDMGIPPIELPRPDEVIREGLCGCGTSSGRRGTESWWLLMAAMAWGWRLRSGRRCKRMRGRTER